MNLVNGKLKFHDTNRGHMFSGKLLQGYEDGFAFEVFEQEGAWVNGLWVFHKVTLQDFRQHLCHTVGNGEALAKTSNTTEELWEWYRKMFSI